MQKFFSLRILSTLLLLLVSSTFLFAQEEQTVRRAHIKLLARPSKDSIVLRWAPTTPGGWRIANTRGYIVERMTIDRNTGNEKTPYQRITNRLFQPLPLEVWKEYAGESNDFSAIAAQAVYGKSFTPGAGKTGGVAELQAAADELLNRYSFALYAADNDAITANALGLRFVDTTVRSGERYVYRVYLSTTIPDYTFDTAYVMIDAIDVPPAEPPLAFRFESGDGSIKLFWDVVGEQPFSGYFLYRSSDGKNFTKLTPLPLIIPNTETSLQSSFPCYVDTATINYKRYTYRLVGITPFAELSKPAVLVAFSRDLTPPQAPVLHAPRQLSATQVKLSWDQHSIPDDFRGFIVARSQSPDRDYTPITKHPLRQNEYIDVLETSDAAYYAVASVDTAGNYAFSLPVYIALIDSTPPPPPKGVYGKIQPDGKVTLWWNRVKKRNILGYRVLRANDPTHEFTQATGTILPDTVYVDSLDLRVLTKKIYYRVATIDKHYQHSIPSELLVLQKPDVLPPSAPVFRNTFVTDSAVYLSWNMSPSADIARQILLRREEGSSRWIPLDTLAPRRTEYVDKRVQQNKRYFYTLVCIDSAGLRSEEALSVMARPFDSGKRDPVTHFTAKYNKATKVVTLTWDYTPQKKETFWFVVYKATPEGVMKEYASVNGDRRIFQDSTPVNGKNEYGIVVLTSLGGEAPLVKTDVIVPSH